jgi:hypothetical protein
MAFLSVRKFGGRSRWPIPIRIVVGKANTIARIPTVAIAVIVIVVDGCFAPTTVLGGRVGFYVAILLAIPIVPRGLELHITARKHKGKQPNYA